MPCASRAVVPQSLAAAFAAACMAATSSLLSRAGSRTTAVLSAHSRSGRPAAVSANRAACSSVLVASRACATRETFVYTAVPIARAGNAIHLGQQGQKSMRESHSRCANGGSSVLRIAFAHSFCNFGFQPPLLRALLVIERLMLHNARRAELRRTASISTLRSITAANCQCVVRRVFVLQAAAEALRRACH
jgi:hypothetical protein